ncbi:TolC family protein [Ketobacter sp. MCCC 1A13808]|uniref:TolC family protein n=1 Tax=Ketobacter sp. MCCC 1A13808 TaxID=2602738 RepID=UPI000F0DAD37|nr:TolC family protein [Ketobacter sp. MCCC 1A13808]MVF12235.1 TolC family protein [Ketobacter sp. MCCC 1A13808]RLP53773.1 MAG: TolC family protein [Ketobacter sp.]
MRFSSSTFHPLAPVFTGIILLGLSACAMHDPQPDYQTRVDQQVNQIPHWSTQSGVAQIQALINSVELEALVNEALAHNPGLQQTLLTLQSAMVDLKLSDAERLPTVDAGFEAERVEAVSATTYTGSVTVGWQLDLWAQQANASAAVQQDVTQQRLLYQSARDTLATDVMTAWLNLIYLQRALDIEQQRLASYELNESVVLGRYRKGLGTLEDLDAIRTSLASGRATVVSYQENLSQQQRALQTLLGRTRADPLAIPRSYPDVLQPLVELPEVSLQRRPDLQAAYASILAEELRTRVAYKDLLPSINVQAALNDMAAKPGEALLTDPIWNLLGQLTLPLFHGGALRAQVNKQELATSTAYEAYRGSLLNAVEEVDNALSQEQSLQLQQAHIEQALLSAQNNLQQYQRKYRTGAVSILDLLSVQQTHFDLQSQLDVLILNRLSNRITLALALGLGVDV